jgi:hypothetical protein
LKINIEKEIIDKRSSSNGSQPKTEWFRKGEKEEAKKVVDYRDTKRESE